MATDPNRPPNKLRPRRSFQGDARDLLRRLKDEIKELEKMKKAGFTHTTDGQSIDWQISVRNEFIRNVATYRRALEDGEKMRPLAGVNSIGFQPAKAFLRSRQVKRGTRNPQHLPRGRRYEKTVGKAS